MHALRFAAKVVAVIAVGIAVLWTIGALFRLSLYAGVAAVMVIATALYETADRWLRWVPGLLIFGVFNSVIALSTGHAPSNGRDVPVSLSLLMLAFYAAGTFFAFRLKAITHLDRVAWLIYLSGMVMPAVLETHAVLTRTAVLPMAAGVAAIVVAWTRHQFRYGRRRGDRLHTVKVAAPFLCAFLVHPSLCMCLR